MANKGGKVERGLGLDGAGDTGQSVIYADKDCKDTFGSVDFLDTLERKYKHTIINRLACKKKCAFLIQAPRSMRMPLTLSHGDRVTHHIHVMSMELAAETAANTFAASGAFSVTHQLCLPTNFTAKTHR